MNGTILLALAMACVQIIATVGIVKLLPTAVNILNTKARLTWAGIIMFLLYYIAAMVIIKNV